MNLMKYFKSNKMFYAFVITMLLISCSSQSQSSDPFSSADELTKSSENKSSNIDNNIRRVTYLVLCIQVCKFELICDK